MTLPRLSLLLSLAALVACGDKDDDTAADDTGHDHSDHDTDADTDAGTDSDTDAGTDDDTDAGTDDDTDTTTGDSAAGETIYAATCGSDYCHGPDGASGSAPDHPDVIPTKTDDEIRTILAEGQGYMGSQNLDETQTADVIAYLRLTFP
jgi:mono/diheme cytochrome c family protein